MEEKSIYDITEQDRQDYLQEQINMGMCVKRPLVVNDVSGYRWNVVPQEKYQAVRNMVFDGLADMIANTYGPYGAPTFIDNGKTITSTKDGWNTVKGVRYNDLTANSVAQLIRNICQNSANEVGDGSTTAVIGANKILKRVSNSDTLNAARSKDLLDSFKRVSSKLNARIENNATKIETTDFDSIRKVALVTSNGDEEIADIVTKIYKKTGNSTIAYEKSGGLGLEYSIEEGFKSKAYMIDRIYANLDGGICKLRKPFVLLLDHQITAEYHMNNNYKQNIISRCAEYAIANNRKLVIIAPFFDSGAKTKIQRELHQAMVQAKELGTVISPTVIYSAMPSFSTLGKIEMQDLSSFTGAEVLMEAAILDEEYTIEPERVLGTVDELILTDKFMNIKGFTNMDKPLLEQTKSALAYDINTLKERIRRFGGSQVELVTLTNRLTKLSGKLAIIHVGGDNELQRDLKYDSVEDVIKACESAYSKGYNPGGSIAIPRACNDLLKEMDSSTSKQDILDKEVIKCIGMAFKDVFAVVLVKIFDDAEKISNIINESVNTGIAYNALTEEWDGDVINPVMTDVCILKATMSLISLLISANQYITTQVDQPLNVELDYME